MHHRLDVEPIAGQEIVYVALRIILLRTQSSDERRIRHLDSQSTVRSLRYLLNGVPRVSNAVVVYPNLCSSKPVNERKRSIHVYPRRTRLLPVHLLHRADILPPIHGQSTSPQFHPHASHQKDRDRLSIPERNQHEPSRGSHTLTQIEGPFRLIRGEKQVHPTILRLHPYGSGSQIVLRQSQVDPLCSRHIGPAPAVRLHHRHKQAPTILSLVVKEHVTQSSRVPRLVLRRISPCHSHIVHRRQRPVPQMHRRLPYPRIPRIPQRPVHPPARRRIRSTGHVVQIRKPTPLITTIRRSVVMRAERDILPCIRTGLLPRQVKPFCDHLPLSRVKAQHMIVASLHAEDVHQIRLRLREIHHR